jgi:8-oxo-dGTP pyrophosphatase MutT (NUDIX family)
VIPFRLEQDKLNVMLITSRNRKRWIIPKGIIEKDISAAESARREAFEEAGLRGRVSRKPIGRYRYRKWGDTCDVQVFLLKIEQVLDEWPESSVRQRRWATVEEAANLVEEQELGGLIRNLPLYSDADDLSSES